MYYVPRFPRLARLQAGEPIDVSERRMATQAWTMPPTDSEVGRYESYTSVEME